MFNESSNWNIALVKHRIIVFPQYDRVASEGQIIINERTSVIQGALECIIIRLNQTTLFDLCIVIPYFLWAQINSDK